MQAASRFPSLEKRQQEENQGQEKQRETRRKNIRGAKQARKEKTVGKCYCFWSSFLWSSFFSFSTFGVNDFSSLQPSLFLSHLSLP